MSSLSPSFSTTDQSHSSHSTPLPKGNNSFGFDNQLYQYHIVIIVMLCILFLFYIIFRPRIVQAKFIKSQGEPTSLLNDDIIKRKIQEKFKKDFNIQLDFDKKIDTKSKDLLFIVGYSWYKDSRVLIQEEHRHSEITKTYGNDRPIVNMPIFIYGWEKGDITPNNADHYRHNLDNLDKTSDKNKNNITLMHLWSNSNDNFELFDDVNYSEKKQVKQKIEKFFKEI